VLAHPQTGNSLARLSGRDDPCARVATSDIPAEQAEARLGELQRSFLDPMRAATELGFTAMVELEDGLRATWDWIRSNEKD